MVLRLRYAAVSDVGMVRQGNEDSALASPALLVLADGMGGHAGGEVASAAAVRSLQDLAPPGSGDPTEVIRRAVAVAGQRLRDLVVARPELEGMGTTLTLLMHSGDRIAIAQVGDSRGYLLREGVLERVTQDQTFVQSLIDQGRISDEEAKTHPQRNLLLQALDGREEVEPVVVLRTPRPGDRYLLCSDGLSSVVSEPTLRDVLAVGTPTEAAHRLVDLAIRAGAPDNVTCLVADVVDEPDDVEPPQTVVVGAAADSPHARAVGLANGSSGAAGAEPAAGQGAHGAQGDHGGEGDDGEGDDGEGDGGDADDEGQHEHDDPKGRPRGLRLTLPVLLLLALAGIAAVVGYRWTQTQYYVGVSGGEVAIYRGVPQHLVGRSLSQLVEPTGVEASTLPSFAQDQVSDTIAAGSLVEARRIVDRLRIQSALCTTTTTTATASPTATPVTKTTTPKPAVSTKPTVASTPSPAAGTGTSTPAGCPPQPGATGTPGASATTGASTPAPGTLVPSPSGSPTR